MVYFILLILIWFRCFDFFKYEKIEIGNISGCVLFIFKVFSYLILNKLWDR